MKIATYSLLLREAEQSRRAIPPLSEKDAAFSVDEAYAVQLANVQYAQEQGHLISGKKIGLTSEGIQKQLGVEEPDYGHLFASMECADGRIPCEELILPKIEAEIAFVLKEDLAGGQVTVADVRRATDYVVGAFEIVDSRIADWRIKLVDTIADNASSGRYQLGTVQLSLDELEPAAVTMVLRQNGQTVAEGSGAAVMGDPCLSVAWLANRLWDYGVPLRKGEVILSGAFSAAPPAQKGDVFEAEFSQLGTIRAEFI